MEETPLYDALEAFAAQNPTRFHMPGHKGRGRGICWTSPSCPPPGTSTAAAM